MVGLSKGESLNLLASYGMNTPMYFVFKPPFNREEMMLRSFDFPGNISIRTWKRGEIMCPFFPNKFGSEIPYILDTLFSGKPLDEIIFSEGINPGESLFCGKVHHLDIPGDEAYAVVEYFEGPGTVRDLDNKPHMKMINVPRYGGIEGEKYEWVVGLVRKCRMIFHDYPKSTLEWSIYPNPIGTRKDPLIWWELLR